MKTYNEQAERLMKRAADREKVPGNLHAGIMRAIRTADKGKDTAVLTAGWRARVAMAAAVVAIVAGLCLVHVSNNGKEPDQEEADILMSIGPISDANPAALLSTQIVEDEIDFVEEDVVRAATFCVAKMDAWSSCLTPES